MFQLIRYVNDVTASHHILAQASELFCRFKQEKKEVGNADIVHVHRKCIQTILARPFRNTWKISCNVSRRGEMRPPFFVSGRQLALDFPNSSLTYLSADWAAILKCTSKNKGPVRVGGNRRCRPAATTAYRCEWVRAQTSNNF